MAVGSGQAGDRGSAHPAHINQVNCAMDAGVTPCSIV
jgi:hypothetical protein